MWYILMMGEESIAVEKSPLVISYRSHSFDCCILNLRDMKVTRTKIQYKITAHLIIGVIKETTGTLSQKGSHDKSWELRIT